MSLFLKMFVATHVGMFRATGGKLGSTMSGAPIVLLTTKGCKTGKERTVPVMAFDDGGTPIVVASFGGAPTHPAWFKNLEKDPNVTVQTREKRFAARAEIVSGEERARLWKKITTEQPRFAEYEKKATGREIPVVALRQAAS